jgi:copper(I)-binding protein
VKRVDQVKKIGFLLFILLIASLLSACSAADSADCSNLPAGMTIKIDGAWSRAVEISAPGSGTSAAYLTINNCGTQPDALLSAASDAAQSTEVHVTETRNGITTMTHVDKIDIPAGKKVELKEGGYHVMMMKVKQSIKPGDPLEITLSFEKAGDIKVTAPARNP